MMTNFSNVQSQNPHLTDEFIQSVYGQMLNFAKNQLRDDTSAEDVVQETFVNAFKYIDNFKGNSAFKTWVFAILKNKIADHIRQNQKYVKLSDFGNDEQSHDEILQTLFDEIGHWQVDSPIISFDNSWENPENHAYQDDFWQVMEACLQNLPSEQARAFLMREYIELSTEEICQEMAISSQNFYVLMHRARLRLQKCLSIHWFSEN